MPSYTCHDAQSSTRFVPAYNELVRCLKLKGYGSDIAYKARTATVTQSDLNTLRYAVFNLGFYNFIDMDAVEAALSSNPQGTRSEIFDSHPVWGGVTRLTPFFLLLPGRCTSTGQDLLASTDELSSALG